MGQCVCLSKESYQSSVNVPMCSQNNGAKNIKEENPFNKQNYENRPNNLFGIMKKGSKEDVEDNHIKELDTKEINKNPTEDEPKIKSNTENNSTKVKIDTKKTNAKQLDKKEINISYQSNFKQRVKGKKDIHVVMIGDVQVGKSALSLRIQGNAFEKLYIPTIQKEAIQITKEYNSTVYNILFIVTAGDKQYREDYSSLYEKSDIFLLVFDLTNKNSLDYVIQLFNNEIKKFSLSTEKEHNNIYFIGNKSDEYNLRKIKNDEILSFCDINNLTYIETSAKTYKNLGFLIGSILNFFDYYSRQDN